MTAADRGGDPPPPVVGDGKLLTPVVRVVAVSLAMLGASAALLLTTSGGSSALDPSGWWVALLIGGLFAVAEHVVFHIELRREAITFSLSEIPTVLALVYLDVRVAVAARVIGSMAAIVIDRRPTPHKALFNAALFTFETVLAAFVVRASTSWPDGSVVWFVSVLVASVGVGTFVGSVLVSFAIAQFEGDFLARVRSGPVNQAWLFGLNATIAGLTFVPGLVSPWLGAAALVPIAVVWLLAREHGRVSQALRDLDAVHGFAAGIAGATSLDDIVRVSAVDVARLLRAQQVGVVVFDVDGVSVRADVGSAIAELPDRSGDARSARIVAAEEQHPGNDAVPLIGGGMVVTIRGDAGPLGHLAVRGREGASGQFGKEDARRLHTLAGQLAASVGRGVLLRQLEFEARHDALTGLANRAAFERALSTMCADRRTSDASSDGVEPGGLVFVVMFDLDRFKEVNDTLGHHAGDALLIDFARRLDAATGEHDQLARFAGDEFALAGRRDSVREIDAFVRSCLEATMRPFSIDGLELVIAASAGVAVRTEPDDATTLLRRADIAMYHAKAHHLGHDFYREEIDRRTPARLSMLTDLHTAIHDGRIELHFQPKLELATGVVIGAEVLARWRHPLRGWVPPTEFVRVAEESALIRPLTDLVVAGSLAALAHLHEVGHRIGFAVNLSTQDLLDETLADRVEHHLVACGVDADFLTLEITEGSLLYDSPRAAITLARLRSLGVHLAIDDFGTGYSSLRYLRRLPVTELKIDHSFVVNLMLSDQDEVIVRSTIDLGHNLGLRVVAEGVEDPEVVDRLRAMGCDVAQGFEICRPLPLADFERWLADR